MKMQYIYFILLILAVDLSVDAHRLDPNSEKDDNNKQTLKIRQILEESGNAFTQEEFNKLFIRKDGMNHLLLSDVKLMIKQLEEEFPEIIKVSSIGQTWAGRDIPLVTLDATSLPYTGPPPPAAAMSQGPTKGRRVKKVSRKSTKVPPQAIKLKVKQHRAKTEQKATFARAPPKNPAILITGAHHSRELITVQMALFTLLRLLQGGVVHQEPYVSKMVRQNKYYFIPVVNVDGLAQIEEDHSKQGRNDHIFEKRKNLGQQYKEQEACDPSQMGVDLNRNYGVDWSLTQEEKIPDYACSEFFAGQAPFSEKETMAMKDFLKSAESELRFVINFHSNGPAFIWAFNGRYPNDIEERAPMVLPILEQISDNAVFPDGTLKGNSAQVVGKAIGGDADDYITQTYGIPSVTAEIGEGGKFVQQWVAKSKEAAFSIMDQNVKWVDYIFLNLPDFSRRISQIV